MKTKCLFILLLFPLFASLCLGESKTDTEWFPFVIGEKLDPGSPANIGKIVLDAPAGKHGFVKARNGHFYFQDGTRAKFWGTNLVFSACFPSKEQAKALADRLAFFGFNAVRLHHMDSSFEPEGIFMDTCPWCTDPQMKKTGVLSEKQLDRLDYLIYQLKMRGIYININLLVSRQFTKADGVATADQLNMAAKPASLFDPKLIELQKKYARDLLTHYNPYTKLRYCDDSVIALVEITNENSIFMSEGKSLPAYYTNQLKGEKDEKTFLMELETFYFQDMTDFLKKECHVKVPITGIGGYWQKEDIQAQKSCDFIDAHSYWDHPDFPNEPWDKTDFKIHNKSMLIDQRLGLIDNLQRLRPKTHKKPYTISEWNHCYPNQFAYEAPVLLACEAIKNDYDAIFQFSFTGTPSISSKIENYFDISANPQQLLLLSLGSSLYLKNTAVKTTIKKGIYSIKSEILEGAIGFIQNKSISLGPFTITPAQNGAVILYKLPAGFFLVCVGQVKNTRTNWNKTVGFNWGESPVLLQNIGAVVQVSANYRGYIYALDDKGSRKERIVLAPSNAKNSFSTAEYRSPWFEISDKKEI